MATGAAPLLPVHRAVAMSSLLLSTALVALCFGVGVGTASAADAPPSPDGGVFTFVIENDVLGELSQDRNYTNGVKLGWMTPKGGEPRWADAMAKALTPIDAASDTRLEFEIGQSMFTPGDLAREIPDPLDRPYAGLAYVSMGLIDRQEGGRLDQYQLVLGIVGPSSRAKEVQRWVHDAIDAREPRGWDTQIRDRFVGELRFQHSRRLRVGDAGRTRSRGFEWTPHAGVSLGNLTTGANVGIGLRFGRNLPEDFGPPRISPGLPGSGYFEPDGGRGWYLFGGLDLRYVAHSIVLDEPSRTGGSVRRRPWVADAQGGIAFYTRSFRAAYTQVWRTREFETQEDRFSSFGALSLTWRH